MSWKRRPDLRKKAIGLREEALLSNREIHRALDEEVNISTIVRWLKNHPLPQELRDKKHTASADARRYSQTGPSGLWQSTDVENLSNRQKGQIAEAAVSLRCLLHGMSVFSSAYDGNTADRIVETPGGHIWKLQVRWCRKTKRGAPLVKLVCENEHRYRRFQPGDFDFIVGYSLYEDTAFVFSWDETAALKKSVSVTEDSREAWHKLLGEA